MSISALVNHTLRFVRCAQRAQLKLVKMYFDTQSVPKFTCLAQAVGDTPNFKVATRQTGEQTVISG